MKKPLLILSLLSAGLAASCIYPFEVSTETEAGHALVVEGDIIVGGITRVTISDLMNLTQPSAPHIKEYVLDLRVEDENGTSYSVPAGYLSGGPTYEIDTRGCNPAFKHRLYIMTAENEYASDWQDVHISPVIDSISVNPDRDRNKMFIGLSCHSDKEQYFRWNYSETWEYHTPYIATVKYEVPIFGTPTWNNGYGIISKMESKDQTYTCWNSSESKEVKLFSTEHQSDNRFVDLDFLSIDRDSYKLMSMYYINISVQSLSEEAYRYWETLNKSSSMSGDLFSPIPSELEGNIRCLTDKDRLVVGFISASTSSTADRFVDNLDTKFYKSKPEYYLENRILPEAQWLQTYLNGQWRPFTDSINDKGELVYEWAETPCVDCRARGGKTVKPDFWPR